MEVTFDLHATTALRVESYSLLPDSMLAFMPCLIVLNSFFPGDIELVRCSLQLHCFAIGFLTMSVAYTTPCHVCRESYPPVVIWIVWATCEISIVALDLTMLLGRLVDRAPKFCLVSAHWMLVSCIDRTVLVGRSFHPALRLGMALDTLNACQVQ
eukprot:scaffold16075_cov19-Tisochrysis_lutea.AAC.3